MHHGEPKTDVTHATGYAPLKSAWVIHYAQTPKTDLVLSTTLPSWYLKLASAIQANTQSSICIRLRSWFLKYCYSTVWRQPRYHSNHHFIHKDIIQLVPLTVTSPFTKTHILPSKEIDCSFFGRSKMFTTKNFHLDLSQGSIPGLRSTEFGTFQVKGFGERLPWNVATRRSRWDPRHPLRYVCFK